jgi:hypothetical protein
MLNIGYAIPKGEPYLDEAPPEIVAKNTLVWTETYPHFSAESQDVYKDVAIIDTSVVEEVADGTDAAVDDSETGSADDAGDEGPLDVDALFAAGPEEIEEDA